MLHAFNSPNPFGSTATRHIVCNNVRGRHNRTSRIEETVANYLCVSINCSHSSEERNVIGSHFSLSRSSKSRSSRDLFILRIIILVESDKWIYIAYGARPKGRLPCILELEIRSRRQKIFRAFMEVSTI
jgi:hypothetical protein